MSKGGLEPPEPPPSSAPDIGLQLFVIQPLSVSWLISAFDYIHPSPDIICIGFKDFGILGILSICMV